MSETKKPRAIHRARRKIQRHILQQVREDKLDVGEAGRRLQALDTATDIHRYPVAEYPEAS